MRNVLFPLNIFVKHTANLYKYIFIPQLNKVKKDSLHPGYIDTCDTNIFHPGWSLKFHHKAKFHMWRSLMVWIKVNTNHNIDINICIYIYIYIYIIYITIKNNNSNVNDKNDNSNSNERKLSYCLKKVLPTYCSTEGYQILYF